MAKRREDAKRRPEVGVHLDNDILRWIATSGRDKLRPLTA
jgi:hypothetical protein